MNKYRLLSIVLALFFAAFLSGKAFAVLFTSEDKAFTVDLPSTWVKVNSEVDVLSLKRDSATMKITRIEKCDKIICIQEAIDKDLAFVKSKKFKVLENTYTGEVIKTTEFSTGDPLLSINYSGASTDFTTAYFLADGKAYGVAIKGIPYVEADLILSFISPAPKPTDAKAGANPPALEDLVVSDISADDLPAIAVTSEEAAKPAEVIIDTPQSADKPKKQTPGKSILSNIKPIDIIFVIAGLYALTLLAAFILRVSTSSKNILPPSNPKSKYPIKGSRLYGSPDLFFKLHDNQGNNFIVNSSRWGSILMALGITGAIVFFAVRFGVSNFYAAGRLDLHTAIVNTIISVASLFSVVGLVIFTTGFMLNLLFAYKLFFYNDKGDLVFKCLQKGFFPLKEEYVVADSKSTVICRIRRNKFVPLRKWTIYNNEGVIAEIKEKSALRAVLRLFLGHLCGFLRADYTIAGRVGSKGAVISYSRIFTYFRTEIDKPEAVESNTMLIATALIFIRDRDKWHPWVN